MEPQRTWAKGDVYWALWVDATHRKYIAVLTGTVESSDSRVVRFRGGAWRYIDEGLPFKSQAAAREYIRNNPLDSDEAPPSGVVSRTSAAKPTDADDDAMPMLARVSR